MILAPDKLYEIVDGQPEAKVIPGARHGGICGRLAVELGMYLKAHPCGTLYAVRAIFGVPRTEEGASLG